MFRQECRVGMRVTFGRDGRFGGQQTTGIVVKCNNVRAKVQINEPRGKTDVGAIWSVPYSMMEPLVQTEKVTNGNEHIMAAIAECYCALSPENLSCDNELPLSQVRIKRNQLEAKLNSLFLALGRKVSEMEILDWERKKVG